MLGFREQSAGQPPVSDRSGERMARAERKSNFVAVITVSRTARDDVGIREIYVSMDGEQLAILSHGGSFTQEVPAGPHRLRAHNTLFWKTLDVVLQPGEHARYRVINKAGWGTFGLLMVLGASPLYLTFEREAD